MKLFLRVGSIIIKKMKLNIMVSKSASTFSKINFREEVISRRANRRWPAHCPDLSLFDYWFWGDMGRKHNIVWAEEDGAETAATMDEARVHRAVENLRRRVSLCVKNNGGHFEAET